MYTRDHLPSLRVYPDSFELIMEISFPVAVISYESIFDTMLVGEVLEKTCRRDFKEDFSAFKKEAQQK